MDSMIIDGSHFDGVSQAKARARINGYNDNEVELLCNEETETYTLQTTNQRPTVIATFKY